MLKNKKAFTLIELLIVIVIIAVLAAIGVIAFERYGADSRNSRRLADMEKVRSAMASSCHYSVVPHACEVGVGNTAAVLSSCATYPDNPDTGHIFMNLTTVKDPTSANQGVLLESFDDPGDYSIQLVDGEYDQCDTSVLFNLESGSTWVFGCMRNSGVEYPIVAFDDCLTVD